jgi:leucyl-tRNA synthetase
VAPEHPLIDALLAHPQPQTDIAALSDYVNTARNRSDVDRQEGKEKTGVYTGIDAINPANGQPIPVWTSDYVLMGYGTGAIMAVPAHDQRDFEFAKRFGLPIVDVVYPRVIAAMAYYSRNATDEERQNPRWMTVLADLLGIVTSGDIDPGGFDDALHRVRTVRATTPDTVPARPVNFEGMLTPSDLRGASQVTWIEALDSLGFDSFEALYNRFVDGGFYAHSGEAYTGKGSAVNSASSLIDLNGMGTENAKAAMIDTLERARQGRRKINYRLRDWLFSRQRYWGEPFPIVFDEQGLHHPLDESALPVKLPEMADYQPIESNDPAPLLAKATQWVHTTAAQAGATHLPPATPVTRETNTMPGWAGSCWYYLRYCDPKNNLRFASREAEHYWMGEQGVDLYVGGSEHAVLHLLYARFWHQILFDLGEVSSPEPFKKLFHQGLILSYAFQRKDKSLVAVDAVIERDGAYYEQATGDPVTRTMAKMSKTLKNVVNPDDIIAEFGADTFRLYEMYMGPLEASAPWNTDDIIGLFRFLQRAWRLVIDESTGQLTLLEKSDATIEKKLHRTIAKVGDDIERLAFNTAIAAMIEFVNAATAAKGLSRDQLDRFVRTLAPFCPHMADELWHRLGHDGAVAHAQWSSIDQSMLHDDQIEIPVQIMGKVRAKITIPSDADQKTMEALAMADERVKELLVGKTVQKVVAIPGRMVNIVAN